MRKETMKSWVNKNLLGITIEDTREAFFVDYVNGLVTEEEYLSMIASNLDETPDYYYDTMELRAHDVDVGAISESYSL